MLEVTRYKTEDGRVFETKEEAKDWERRAILLGKMAEDLYGRDTRPEEVLDWMLENKDFVLEFLGD